MEKKIRSLSIITAVTFLLFVAFTLIVIFVDVQPIGPMDSSVGLATINKFMWEKQSASPLFDKITDIIAAFSIAVGLGFACLGVYQLIKRKSLKKVDIDLYTLGGLYVLLGIFYVLFEVVLINYAPYLKEGNLVHSYPSSHTFLIVTILMSAVSQLEKRLRSKKLFNILALALDIITVTAVILREQAGVHWFTDIVGALLLSIFLLALYSLATALLENKFGKINTIDSAEKKESDHE